MSKILIRLIALLLVPCLIMDSASASVSFPKVPAIQSHTNCFTSQALSNLALAFSKLRMGKQPGTDDITFVEAGFPRQEPRDDPNGEPPSMEDMRLRARSERAIIVMND